MLLHDWSPVIPGHPSTLERNAKWWIDRNAGTYLLEAGQIVAVERRPLEHVSEFAKVNIEGTDEHLAGSDQLARLYNAKWDCPKAKKALWGPVETFFICCLSG